MYPKFRITKEESKHSIKYEEPGKTQRGVLNRIYPGNLILTETVQTPMYPFFFARRTRVVALTASGNIPFFRMQIKSATGEEYTTGMVPMTHLVGGPSVSPLGYWAPEEALQNAIYLKNTTYPYVFEPNIVLLPNQTLMVYGAPMIPWDVYNANFRVDFCLHVVEFPGDAGSPK